MKVAKHDIVVVSDGQYSWGADAAELRAALDYLGWSIEHETPFASFWMEVLPASDDDPSESYTALCQRVQPVAGMGPEDRFDDLDFPRFMYRPDVGRGAWEWTKT
jgi:hypothetical protein